MREMIRLDTQEAVMRLVEIASKVNDHVWLKDGNSMCVSAKSLLGAVCARFDFTEIWLETEEDHYFLFKDFIIGE